MQIAIFSDIHGNLVALDAVLADLETVKPDQTVCLGDVVVMGPQPAAVLARLRSLGCPVVMGNTDEWVLNPQPFTIRNDDDQKMYEVELWGAEQMTEDDKAFIRTFQPTVVLDLGHGRSLLCYHGSPHSNTATINARTTDAELAQKLGSRRTAVMAGGHTHEPLLRRFQESFILNPGSVGLPFLRTGDKIINPPWAEYALLTAREKWLHIELRQVPLSLNAIKQAAFQSDMPHAEWWADEWEAPA